jgi:hypothetical protein
MNQDREIAYRILTALCESSIIEEMNYYKNYIQRDLLLSDDEINRVYSLKTITELLKPLPEVVRTYKGMRVEKDEKPKQVPEFNFITPARNLDAFICAEMTTPGTIDTTETGIFPITTGPGVAEPATIEPSTIEPSTTEPATIELIRTRPSTPAPEQGPDLVSYLTDQLRKHSVPVNELEITLNRIGRVVRVSGAITKNYRDELRALGGTYKNKIWLFGKDTILKNHEPSDSSSDSSTDSDLTKNDPEQEESD